MKKNDSSNTVINLLLTSENRSINKQLTSENVKPTKAKLHPTPINSNFKE